MSPSGEARGSVDAATVEGFGLEWTVYDQSDTRPGVDPAVVRSVLRPVSLGRDRRELRAGSMSVVDRAGGRRSWPSAARRWWRSTLPSRRSAWPAWPRRRRSPLNGSAVELPVADGCLDFAFSLGVLHHLPDTEGALSEIHRVLRRGAPFLVYLYYAFDNRPAWFRLLWRASDSVRRAIARLPHRPRLAVTRLLAAVVYWPLARLSRLLARRGRDVARIPLSAYRDQPFYVMQTDALDRFGTQLEKRYTKDEIRSLLEGAGFSDVQFNEDWPFWCALARA